LQHPGPEVALDRGVIGGSVSWEPGGVAAARNGRPARSGSSGGLGWTLRGPIALYGSAGQVVVAPGVDVCVVADLELVNRDELQILAGPSADTRGLVAALYAEEGVHFVRRLRGAFALALWDGQQRELLLAVDHFGIKRLYYTGNGSSLTFATRAGMLPALGAGALRVDAATVYSYLNFGFVPAPSSAFHGVARLAPGHLLRARDGHAKVDPYWDVTYPERDIPREEAAGRVFHLTEAAVQRALDEESPAEAGAFLSGGTDSSTIVGLMGRVTGERVRAFSIGFQEDVYNELDYAQITARHFGTAHHSRTITPAAALEVLPRLVDAYDEPFGNNSAIGTVCCARLARECGMNLLLAGDGGDEIFGGNERYRTDRIFGAYQHIPRALRRGLLEPILQSLPDGGDNALGRAQRYVRRANVPNPWRFYSYEFFFAQEGAALLHSDFRSVIASDAPFTIVQSHYDRVQATSELNRLLYLDLKLAIGDNDLLKVTRTAELAGLKVRFPLLDLDLVEFTGTLPARFKVRGLEKRTLFKRAFRNLLPPAVLAKRKHGFGVPTSAWLRSDPGFREFARETLLSPRARQRGYFRPGAVETLLEWHRSDSTPYYGDILWRLLMLELWNDRHVDRRAAA
jgi:asparagine synthase (glutamine-hydrolysing)